MPLVLSQTVVPAESRTVVVMFSPADLLPDVRRAVRRRTTESAKKKAALMGGFAYDIMLLILFRYISSGTGSMFKRKVPFCSLFLKE